VNRRFYWSILKIPSPHYRCDVHWGLLEDTLARYLKMGLDLNPDFQRGHVWTEHQQVAYVEWILRGGESGKEVHLNHPNWQSGRDGAFVLVDGLQRLTAVRRFLADEIRAFGTRLSEFDDRDVLLRDWNLSFSFRVCSRKTRAEIIAWYLDFNAGGTPHAASEIERVRALLAAERRS
jgi:hypothetical protein